jgi:hypothetical protein
MRRAFGIQIDVVLGKDATSFILQRDHSANGIILGVMKIE